MTDNKALYTPYIPPESFVSGANPLMHMLKLYNSDDLEACPLDKWGILDPSTHRRDIDEKREDGECNECPLMTVMDATAPDLDVILIPGVAFDKECNRVSAAEL